MSWNQTDPVQIYRTFDWAYAPDPAYCLWIAHLGDRYIAFKERLWKSTIAAQVAKDIVEESDGMKVVTTFCDPSMGLKTGADVRTICDIFEENGVPTECSINNREFYAHHLHTALNTEVEPGVPKLQILARGCPYLIRTLPLQRYDPKHPLRMADHKDDHAAVALAYFLISNSAGDRHNFQAKKKIPKWMRPKTGDRTVLGSESVRDYR